MVRWRHSMETELLAFPDLCVCVCILWGRGKSFMAGEEEQGLLPLFSKCQYWCLKKELTLGHHAIRKVELASLPTSALSSRAPGIRVSWATCSPVWERPWLVQPLEAGSGSPFCGVQWELSQVRGTDLTNLSFPSELLQRWFAWAMLPPHLSNSPKVLFEVK